MGHVIDASKALLLLPPQLPVAPKKATYSSSQYLQLICCVISPRSYQWNLKDCSCVVEPVLWNLCCGT